MKVIIKKLTDDSKMICDVQSFLFKQIKREFGYDYVPKWHQDIMNMGDYYIGPQRNAFFVAYNTRGEIIATIGLRAYDKDFPEFRGIYSKDITSSIWRLFVDRKYRRCGLASKMFSVAESFANECDYENIYLHTQKNLKGALEFWTKMGFIAVLDTNDEFETVHMDKKIQGFEIIPQTPIFQYAVKL